MVGFFSSTNVARRNSAWNGEKFGDPNEGSDAGAFGCVRVCVCVRHCQCNIQPARLYDCDFLRHPQLSLRRITNFAVTFAGKLGSGDDIKTGVGEVRGGREERGGGWLSNRRTEPRRIVHEGSRQLRNMHRCVQGDDLNPN